MHTLLIVRARSIHTQYAYSSTSRVSCILWILQQYSSIHNIHTVCIVAKRRDPGGRLNNNNNNIIHTLVLQSSIHTTLVVVCILLQQSSSSMQQYSQYGYQLEYAYYAQSISMHTSQYSSISTLEYQLLLYEPYAYYERSQYSRSMHIMHTKQR